MQGSASNSEKLNPRIFLEYISNSFHKDEKFKEEVFVRRIISGIYFSLFNYWSIKMYQKGERGKGTNKDCFSYTKFHQKILKDGLEYALFPLYLYRVAVDHYTLNPTKVRLTSEPWKNREYNVEFNDLTLRRLIQSAYEILDHLEKI